jgi:drug/metabolite transporter (DMT)-like permease
MEKYLGAVACTVGLSVGQLLFKMSSLRLSEAKTLFDSSFAGLLVLAMGLYAIVSVAWVMLLQGAELSKLYPIMALSFAFVPLASALVFGDRLNIQYVAGVLLIVAGVVLASTAAATPDVSS